MFYTRQAVPQSLSNYKIETVDNHYSTDIVRVLSKQQILPEHSTITGTNMQFDRSMICEKESVIFKHNHNLKIFNLCTVRLHQLQIYYKLHSCRGSLEPGRGINNCSVFLGERNCVEHHSGLLYCFACFVARYPR